MKLLCASAAIKHWQPYFQLHLGNSLLTLKVPSANTAAQARFMAIQILWNLQKLPNIQIRSAVGIYRHHEDPEKRIVKLTLSTPESSVSSLLAAQTHKLTIVQITNRSSVDRLLSIGIGCSHRRSDVITIGQTDL